MKKVVEKILAVVLCVLTVGCSSANTVSGPKVYKDSDPEYVKNYAYDISSIIKSDGAIIAMPENTKHIFNVTIDNCTIEEYNEIIKLYEENYTRTTYMYEDWAVFLLENENGNIEAHVARYDEGEIEGTIYIDITLYRLNDEGYPIYY